MMESKGIWPNLMPNYHLDIFMTTAEKIATSNVCKLILRHHYLVSDGEEESEIVVVNQYQYFIASTNERQKI